MSVPANTIATPEGFDPGSPAGLFELLPLDGSDVFDEAITIPPLIPPLLERDTLRGRCRARMRVANFDYGLAVEPDELVGTTFNTASTMFGLVLEGSTGSASVDSPAVALNVVYRIQAAAGLFSLASTQTGSIHNRRFEAGPGAVEAVGQSAGLSYAFAPFSLEAASYLVSGQDARLDTGNYLVSDPGAFALSGEAAEKIRNIILRGAAGGFGLSGAAVPDATWAIVAGNAAPMLGASAPTSTTEWTKIQSSHSDDAYVATGSFGFTFTIANTAYTSAFVGSNGYITFGAGYTAYSSLSATVPAAPKIMFYASDRSYTNVYTKSFSSSTGKYFKIRWEGNGQSSSGLTCFIEITLFKALNSDQFIEIRYGDMNFTGGTMGVASSSSYYAFLGNAYANTSVAFKGNATGTSWAVTNNAYVNH